MLKMKNKGAKKKNAFDWLISRLNIVGKESVNLKTSQWKLAKVKNKEQKDWGAYTEHPGPVGKLSNDLTHVWLKSKHF